MTSRSYENILGGGGLSGANFAGFAPPPDSPGGLFVQYCIDRGTTPRNMHAFSAEFHSWLKRRNWRWLPNGTGSLLKGARLLDGTLLEGECAIPVYALTYLIEAPLRYGFDTPGSKLASYKGAGGVGFIAHHIDGLTGPEPNIVDRHGRAISSYRFWDNHKVVSYDSRFYDPNYDREYTELKQMAVASFVSAEQPGREDLWKTIDCTAPAVLGYYREVWNDQQRCTEMVGPYTTAEEASLSKQ